MRYLLGTRTGMHGTFIHEMVDANHRLSSLIGGCTLILPNFQPIDGQLPGPMFVYDYFL